MERTINKWKKKNYALISLEKNELNGRSEARKSESEK